MLYLARPFIDMASQRLENNFLQAVSKARNNAKQVTGIFINILTRQFIILDLFEAAEEMTSSFEKKQKV